MTLELWLKDTMLIERLLGVFVYVAVTVIAYSQLRHTTDFRKRKAIFRRTFIALCVMAFLYVPGASADLCEWQKIFDKYWEHQGLFEFIKGTMLDSNTPLSYLVIYLCEKTGIDGVLPMVSCIVFFTFVFKIFLDTSVSCTLTPGEEEEQNKSSLFKNAKQKNAATYSLALVFLFFMSSGCFLETISGVRCFVALSIVAWCIYSELVKDRKLLKNLIFYMIACTVHLAAIPVVAFRLVYLLIGQFGHKAPKIGTYAVTLFMCLGGVTVGRGLLFAAINKGNSYLTNDRYSYTWEYIIGFLELAVLIVALIRFRKIRNDEGVKNLNALAGFCTFMCTVVTCLCFEYSIFHRYVLFTMIIMIPVIYTVLQSCIKKGDYRFVNFVRIISILAFALACARGNLCGYKFFLLNE